MTDRDSERPAGTALHRAATIPGMLIQALQALSAGIAGLAWHPTVHFLVVLAIGPRILACYAQPEQEGFGEEVDCDPLGPATQPGIAALSFSAGGDVTAVAFSQDGLLLAAGSRDGQVPPKPHMSSLCSANSGFTPSLW